MIFNFEIDELLTQEDKPEEKVSPSKKVLIHLCGTKFSGKSTILEQIKNKKIIYDIADFYKKHNCISKGVMDWDRFREVIHLLQQDVDDFLRRNIGSDLIIIESSGIGKNINRIIDYLVEEKEFLLYEIYLRPPSSVTELARRISSFPARENIGSIEDEINYINAWKKGFSKLKKDDLLVSPNTAIDFINILFEKYKIPERIKKEIRFISLGPGVPK